MPFLRHRLAIAGVVIATAVAVPAAAFASGSTSPSGKPATQQASVKAVKAVKTAASAAARSPLTALAGSAGITANQLDAGLAAAKRAGGNTAAGVAAFAASTGASPATARRVLDGVFGTASVKRPGLTGAPTSVRQLAARLGVSPVAAARALKEIGSLSGMNGVDPASAPFAAIARDLGVSPARLAAALDAVKQGQAGQ
jgi:hypothetical protein